MSMLKCNEVLKSIYLHIDSRDRNHINDPNSNDYRIKLNNFKIKNIKSIELISAKIPKSEYLINDNNNKINFRENSVDYIVTLTVGNYTSLSLATQLENQLNALETDNEYSVNVDNISGLLSINRLTGTNTFSFLFSSGSYSDSLNSNGQLINGNSPRTILGFEIDDYTSGDGSIVSPNKISLNSNDETFIEIDNNMGHIDTIISENNYLKGKIFASIHMDVSYDDIKFFKNTEKKIIKEYFPLMNNLYYLHIKFKNYYNVLYNFRGQENSLLLKINYIEKGFN